MSDPARDNRRRKRNFGPYQVLGGLAALAVGVLLLYALLSWTDDEIETSYGRRRPSDGGKSVNGLAVLSEMFEQAGHRVKSWTRLSPAVETSDVIVWAPDNYDPPSEDTRNFLEKWLRDDAPRTLVYIGRDYDAEIAYWEQVAPRAPPAQLMEVNRRLATAKVNQATERIRMPKHKYAGWFTLKRDEPKRQVDSLEGPWSSGVNARQAEIVLAARLAIPADDELPDYGAPAIEPLLTSGNDVIVTSVVFPDFAHRSKIIVVANGSFLLNLPLVNHEHRKLAARLVDECGYAGNVTFLETGSYDVAIRTGNDDQESSFKQLFIWPLNVIFLHIIVVGTIICLARYPIFGRPRPPADEPRSDFGRHIAALGHLMERTSDTAYAQRSWTHYQQRVRRESGISHAEARRQAQSELAKRVVTIEIRSRARFATSEDLDAVARLENVISQRNVGRVVGTQPRLGRLEMTVEVEDAARAVRLLRAILLELRIEGHVTSP